MAATNTNFNSGLAFQKQAFGTAQGALNPFIQSGTSVLPTLQSLLTPGPSQTATLSQLPGFQFQSQYGTMATENALAARGLGGSSGPLAMGISNYNEGLAGTSFSSLVNALQAYGNMGTTAAGGLASAAGTAGSNVGNLTASTNSTIGTLTSNQDNTIGTTESNLGNAQASGILGVGNALSSGLTGAGNAQANSLLLSKFLANQQGNPTTGGDPNGVYGGSSSSPLPGLTSSDYGEGF